MKHLLFKTVYFMLSASLFWDSSLKDTGCLFRLMIEFTSKQNSIFQYHLSHVSKFKEITKAKDSINHLYIIYSHMIPHNRKENVKLDFSFQNGFIYIIMLLNGYSASCCLYLLVRGANPPAIILCVFVCLCFHVLWSQSGRHDCPYQLLTKTHMRAHVYADTFAHFWQMSCNTWDLLLEVFVFRCSSSVSSSVLSSVHPQANNHSLSWAVCIFCAFIVSSFCAVLSVCAPHICGCHKSDRVCRLIRRMEMHDRQVGRLVCIWYMLTCSLVTFLLTGMGLFEIRWKMCPFVLFHISLLTVLQQSSLITHFGRFHTSFLWTFQGAEIESCKMFLGFRVWTKQQKEVFIST